MYFIGKKAILFSTVFCLWFFAVAQTEFPREFIAHIKLTSGFIAAPSSPELFVGSVQLAPQYTIIPYKMRGGIIAGAFYSARKTEGLFGPTLSYKLTEFKGGYFGSTGNLNISAEHLWGTGKQRLAGAGVNLDLLNRLVVGLSLHRDYRLGNWWWQSSIGLRISKIKKPAETFPQ